MSEKRARTVSSFLHSIWGRQNLTLRLQTELEQRESSGLDCIGLRRQTLKEMESNYKAYQTILCFGFNICHAGSTRVLPKVHCVRLRWKLLLTALSCRQKMNKTILVSFTTGAHLPSRYESLFSLPSSIFWCQKRVVILEPYYFSPADNIGVYNNKGVLSLQRPRPTSLHSHANINILWPSS